ncbi:MAG: ABC transporter permease subunit, partial [Chloroflexi bacterium]
MSEIELTQIKTEGRLSRPSTPSRARTNRAAQRTFFSITLVPVVLIIVVATALVVRAYPILNSYSFSELLFGDIWRPNDGQFGFLPFILGTLWVTTVGVLLAVPPCLLVSVYLAEYAHNRLRTIAKPILDVLAAIPPVVYGVWGLLSIVPFVDDVLAPLSERWLGSIPFLAVTQPTGFGILAGGIVLAVMIAPLIISVIFEVLSTVPNDLRHAALAV